MTDTVEQAVCRERTWAESSAVVLRMPEVDAPSVAGLMPAEQHSMVLAQWELVDALYRATFPGPFEGSKAQRQWAGRRRILVRHEPESDWEPPGDHIRFVRLGPLCRYCTGFGDTPTTWACPDYRDAADGLVDAVTLGWKDPGPAAAKADLGDDDEDGGSW